MGQWVREGRLAAEVDAAGSYRIPREICETGLGAVGRATHAPPPRPAVPPARAHTPDPTPTVWDLVRGLPADATVEVRVTRMEPREWRGQRVAGYVARLTDTVDVEDLRREYGGGSYRLGVFHADDMIGSSAVEVAGEPRVRRDGQGQREDAQRDRDGGEVQRLRRKVEHLKRSPGGDLVKAVAEVGGPILKEVVSAIAQRRDAGPGPLDVVRIIGEVRGLLAPATTDPAGLTEVRRAHRAGVEDGQERSAGGSVAGGEQGIMDQILDLVNQAAPALAPLAAGWLARQAELAAPATPRRRRRYPPHNQHGGDANGEHADCDRTAPARVETGLGQLLRRADLRPRDPPVGAVHRVRHHASPGTGR